jgi:hypothetical protein
MVGAGFRLLAKEETPAKVGSGRFGDGYSPNSQKNAKETCTEGHEDHKGKKEFERSKVVVGFDC